MSAAVDIADALRNMTEAQVMELSEALGPDFARVVLSAHAPVTPGKLNVKGSRVLLYVVDAINGFTREGPLADPTSMSVMTAGIAALINQLSDLQKQNLVAAVAAIVLRDAHQDWQLDGDGKVEGYGPHCMAGTAESQLDETVAQALSDCGIPVADFPKLGTDSVVGTAVRASSYEVPNPFSTNRSVHLSTWRLPVLDTIKAFRPHFILLVGDCDDICNQVARTLYVAAISGLLCSEGHEGSYAPTIVIYTPGTCTFSLVIPDVLKHNGPLFSHMGRAIMPYSGVTLVDEIVAE